MKHHMPYDRATRLADQIYRIVSRVCYQELGDPRLNGVQITQARLTKDLRTVRIYFHLMDAKSDDIERAKSALLNAKGVFKKSLSTSLPLKYMPEFEFFYDETSDIHEHLEEVFAEIDRGRSS